MILFNLLKDTINQKLQESCVNKQISFFDYDTQKEIQIFCIYAELIQNPNIECYVVFTDDKGKKYSIDANYLAATFNIKN